MLLNFFFPESCIFCKISGNICCKKCFDAIPLNINFQNNTLSIYKFSNDKINKLIWQMKYHHSGSISKLFAPILASHLLKTPLSPLFQKEGKQVRLDINIYLIPIPLNKDDKRLHNHAELLANEIKNNFNIPVNPTPGRTDPLQRGASANTNISVLNNILIKNSKQKQSHTKSRQERFENIKGAFTLNPSLWEGTERSGEAKGVYIIVDDVTTSGATINEARHVLSRHLNVSESSIFAITIAH